MKKRCSNNRDGLLLSAYELGLLSEIEAERFEIHLLTCEYCHHELTEFAQHAATLQKDHRALASLRPLVPHASNRPSRWSTIKEYLWPNTPLVIRQAILLLVIAALASPPLLTVMSDESSVPKPVPVDVVTLVPERAASRGQATVEGHGLLIQFVYPEAQAGQSYLVRLHRKDDRGASLEQEARFDGAGLGFLYFAESLPDGSYRLSIFPKFDLSGKPLAEYGFVLR